VCFAVFLCQDFESAYQNLKPDFILYSNTERAIWDSVPGSRKHFYIFKGVHKEYGDHPVTYFMGTGTKWPGCKNWSFACFQR